jgi:trimeric autotransporter adhesin
VGAGQPVETWALTLESFDEMAKNATAQAALKPVPPPVAPPVAANGARPGAPANRPGTSAGAGDARPAAPTDDPIAASARNFNAADGFLINGTVNNGAASPFAQMAAFGNNRRGARSLYNGGLGILLGNSAWDAAPHSFTSNPVPSPSYDDVQVLGSFGGPIRLPHIRNGPTVFVGYQRIVDHNTSTLSARMPTLAERRGDFSQSVNTAGTPVRLVDPATGQAFPDNKIPDAQISAPARALVDLYPNPNVFAAGQYNYQLPVLSTTRSDNLQARGTQSFGRRDSLSAVVAYAHTTNEGPNLFGFVDEGLTASTAVTLNWQHRFSQFMNIRGRYEFTRQSTNLTPFFSEQENISGEAGITGNNQDPVNWGPPGLSFSSGLAGLSTGQYARNTFSRQTWSSEVQRIVGRHNLSIGGGLTHQEYDVLSQQNARGTFGFTGALSGSDFGDFLLGLPSTSAIAFGNADKTLHGVTGNAYVSDDWRVSPSLTVNAGVRWEYESPMTETLGRLVNLDVAPDFSSAVQVAANDPVLSQSGFPPALIHSDWRLIQPRIGTAWRPVPGSSLVVRTGYGVYRNTNVYTSLAMLLAQQPPFSKSSSVTRSSLYPLTLADGFVSSAGAGNTFAIDPDFRVGYAHTWLASAQRDLPASLTMIGTYLGTSGQHLIQEFLPNTYPLGAPNPCPLCPSGFAYLRSNATSLRNAGSIQIRRRLRNGFTASATYTLAKATDNASAFVPTGAQENLSSAIGLAGATIAQDWLNLDGEYGPSSFDQRHNVTVDVQYTTGQGVTGGALLTGWKGRLFKGWTVTSQLSTGSALPATPVYLAPVGGTGVTGAIRGSLTGATSDPQADGSYANPAAFTAPAPGQWGNAGRNSIRGPAPFSLNAGVGRSFLIGERLTADWRIDASNVLNLVTYAGINAIVGSPQFGLPDRANTMRKIQTSLRVRF